MCVVRYSRNSTKSLVTALCRRRNRRQARKTRAHSTTDASETPAVFFRVLATLMNTEDTVMEEDG